MSEVALPPSTCRSIRNGAACSSPICSPAGSTATGSFRPPRRPADESQDQEQHRSKPAYIYLRQSTPGQVLHHRESTERQYALREKARELGWSESPIRTLDQDLGKTGHGDDAAGGLQDFSGGCLDGPGGRGVCPGSLAPGALESRLASAAGAVRAHLHAGDRRGWLLRPGRFQRRPAFRIEGVMAQAELHFLRARLQGGKLNKAKKGELRFPLPVGFCYDEESRIVLDPDEEVRGAVGLVFRLFRETGSAFAVMQRFADRTLRFPKRSYGGAWDGKLIWGRLTHGRVLGLLKNPSYAGHVRLRPLSVSAGDQPGR